MVRKKNKRSEPDRSHPLTLAELAAHDDACSDALIDNAYYRAQIRKNRPKYNPLRGIKEDEIPQILLQKVIVAKDIPTAEKALLQIAGIRRYRSGLRGKAVQENFLRHLRKYIDMYRTDCPWEVSTTNRYTITTFEAAVTSRARIKQHQTIPYLVGTLVPLTADESNQLDTTNRNFSIVCTGRKMNQSIFLGPARFANHDCDSNARLVPKGENSMEVVALRNIEPGTEITVSYGDDYFGPGNIDCLCATCEKVPRNGWSPIGADGMPLNTSSSRASSRTGTPDANTKKRKRQSESSEPLATSQQNLRGQRPAPSPSKLQLSWTPPATSESDLATGEETTVAAVGLEQQNSVHDLSGLSPPISLAEAETAGRTPDEGEDPSQKRRRSSSVLSIRKRQKLDPKPALSLDNSGLVQPALPSPTSQEDDVDAHEIDTDTIRVKLEATEVIKVEKDVPMCGKRSLRKSSQTSYKQDGKDSMYDVESSPEARAITTITTTQMTKTSLSQNVTKPGSNTVMPSIESTSVQVLSNTTINIQPLSATHRTPGDWYLTKKLLAQPHDRWVQCHNERCLDYFLQANGYQTRRECPRCERHSMLYGFPWPKTDPNHRKILERPGSFKEKKDPNLYSAYRRQGRQGKGTWVEGGGDEEERTMDHRTIHRFVLPEDEKTVARRSLLKQAEVERLKGDTAFMTQFGRDGGSKRVLDSEIVERDSMTPDGELRRRSHRIVQARVYADVL